MSVTEKPAIIKNCRICGSSFEAKTERRELCDICQKNSDKAQRRIDKAITESKYRLEEYESQNYHEQKCEQCGKDFVSYGKTSSFCSTECREQHTIETAKCPVCGVLLCSLGIIAKSKPKCCSDECTEKKKWIDARNRGRIEVCKDCGKEFILTGSGYVNTCKDCEKAARNVERAAREAERAENIAKVAAMPKMVVRKCEICGKEFEHHRNAVQYVCGKDCRLVREKKQAEARKKKL